MSDYLDAFWGGPNGFDLGHSGADIERYLRVKVEIVDPVGRFMIATDLVSTGRTVSVPVAVFRVRISGGTRGYERPTEGDLYTVLFSPMESELLLRHVFVPHAIPVRVVALQRQGGFSVQRSHFGLGDFEQYSDIPRLLGQHEPQLGRIDAYLVDHEVEIPGYEPWGNPMPYWGIEGTRMWVPRPDDIMPRREGLTAFDAYIFVDWSAANRRNLGEDSIWIAEGTYEAGGRLNWTVPANCPTHALNCPTRAAATEYLRERLLYHVEHRSRVLIGFDFPYGYPAQTLQHIFPAPLAANPFDLWARFHNPQLLFDTDQNENNRFEAANLLNQTNPAFEGPYWGRR
jgi:hypothetical protein